MRQLDTPLASIGATVMFSFNLPSGLNRHAARVFYKWALWTTALLLSGGSWAQAPGTLDTTFALGNGKIPAISIGTGASSVKSVAIQRDGKILLFGECANGVGVGGISDIDFCVVRLNPDGTLDGSFAGPSGNANGKVIIPMGTLSDRAAAVIVQPDDRIVLAGSCNTASNDSFCFARLLPNGALDATFVGPGGNGAGKIQLSINVKSTLTAMALQPDGKLVAVGMCKASDAGGDFCTARLNTDGSLDTAYVGPAGNGAGKFSFIIGSGIDMTYASSVAIQTDGKVMLVGSCHMTAADHVICGARLNVDGSFDNTFFGPAGTSNGRFTLSVGNQGDLGVAVRIQPDGKIVLFGSCFTGTVFYFCPIRLEPVGSLDTSFDGPAGNGNGKFLIAMTAFGDHASTLHVLPDGKLLLSGTCGPANSDFCVARLHGDGTVDGSFDGPLGAGIGKAFYAIGSSTDKLNATAIQADGKLVMAGECYDSNSARYLFCVARANGGPYAYSACSLDIDGDNQVLATTDTLITTRVALGVRGSAVINGITFPANATRNTWPQIRDYLLSQCGMNVY